MIRNVLIYSETIYIFIEIKKIERIYCSIINSTIKNASQSYYDFVKYDRQQE